MNKLALLLTVIAALTGILTGCGDDTDTSSKPAKDHVWKGQTDAIDQAKNAAAEISKSMESQETQINNQ